MLWFRLLNPFSCFQVKNSWSPVVSPPVVALNRSSFLLYSRKGSAVRNWYHPVSFVFDRDVLLFVFVLILLVGPPLFFRKTTSVSPLFDKTAPFFGTTNLPAPFFDLWMPSIPNLDFLCFSGSLAVFCVGLFFFGLTNFVRRKTLP